MPNYAGKSPMRIRCPHCFVEEAHPVIYTDPETYEKTIDRRWVEYRRREKQCVSCKKNFHTIETPELFFNNVTDRVVQLAREVEGLKGRRSNESTTPPNFKRPSETSSPRQARFKRLLAPLMAENGLFRCIGRLSAPLTTTLEIMKRIMAAPVTVTSWKDLASLIEHCSDGK